MSARTIEELGKLLEGVTICFCTVCCHDPNYGHCYSCRCENHVPEPIMPEVGKLKQALDHWRELAIAHYREKPSVAERTEP
jgi:hypothetical protein